MSNKQPKVSIIIPVYNTKKFLSKCLDSVVRQTMPDTEIIIVDDKYYFKDLQVTHYIEKYKKEDLTQLFVYDDGCIKGFILLNDKEVKKLFVEPVLQSQHIQIIV